MERVRVEAPEKHRVDRDRAETPEKPRTDRDRMTYKNRVNKAAAKGTLNRKNSTESDQNIYGEKRRKQAV